MKQILFMLFAFLCLSTEAQQTEYVDFKTCQTEITFIPSKKMVIGSVFYSFDVKKETDSIYIDAKKMKLELVFINGKRVNYEYDDKRIMIKEKFNVSINNRLDILYSVSPDKAIYFINNDDKENNQIWTQGQGKYTSNWLPSFDDMNEKVEFDIKIIASKDFEVVSNGALVKKEDYSSEGKHNIWHFNMQKPMSSYLVALVVGKYNKKELTSKSGIPIELYYYPEDSAKVEPTYRYTKQMFDFIEEEIGVPYPWQNYKQVPVKDFLYSGMENTSLTIFSDDFMIDKTSFIDKNYVNVNAHELAHQWFGDLVTETEGKHHWLQEGFATYYALLAERDIFGDDYYYWRLYEYFQELKAQDEAGLSTALLDPKASSATFYKKGAWALHVLREEIGDKAFKDATKNYLEKFQYKNVDTNDFIVEVEKVSGKNLGEFSKTWLESDELDITRIKKSLSKNNITRLIYNYISCSTQFEREQTLKEMELEIKEDAYYPLEEMIVLSQQEIKNQKSIIRIKKAFRSKDIKVRQAITKRVTEIPLELKVYYETLLEDKSYVTIESALYNLWSNFPQDRKKYLDKTKTIYGLNDYNVRMLWLLLALVSPDYEADKTESFFNELVSYTSSNNSFLRRQNAFSILSNLTFNEEAIKNLIDATNHHNWRFKSFSKKLLETLSQDEKYKTIISNLQNK